MGDMEKSADETTKKYILITSSIHEIERRMGWSELAYLALNISVFFFTISFISELQKNDQQLLTFMRIFSVLFSLAVGMSICTYWVASLMRMQLKLKLRYFKARFLERKMNCEGEGIFSDEHRFFDPDIHRLESPDNKEVLTFPSSGLTRMDGFFGSAKPRHFSWMMPSIFFIGYWVIFIRFIFNSLK